MDAKNLQINYMTKEYAHLISKWKYDGIYSLYNNSIDMLDSFMDGNHFACINKSSELIGYYCFGEDARIPTIEDSVFNDEFIDIGLGMNPMLCGNGFGASFLKAGLQYAYSLYGSSKFRLSVVHFNERAINVYKRLGFCTQKEVTHLHSGEKFYVMTLIYNKCGTCAKS